MLNVSKGHFVSKPPEEPQAPGHITHSPVPRFKTPPPPKSLVHKKKKAPDQAANYRNTRTTTNKLAASRR